MCERNAGLSNIDSSILFAVVELRHRLSTCFVRVVRDDSGLQVLVEMAKQGKGCDLGESIRDLAEVTVLTLRKLHANPEILSLIHI